jgi:hypothetical protein
MKIIACSRHFSRSFTVKSSLLLFLISLLAGCAGTASKEASAPEAAQADATESAQAAMAEAAESEGETPAASEIPAASKDTPAQQAAVADMIETQAQAAQSGETLPDMMEAPGIVNECKKEDYVKQERQARASIKKGKQATEAGRYGVGFKNAAEYKKWSTMHNTIFTGVSKACAKLSECAKKHAKAKDKDKQCAEQAQAYADWKHEAKRFTHLVKSVETTQPPLLCSSPLAMTDPPHCFEEQAAKIDQVCDSDDCKNASQCWRSVKILYGAINQEESACRFMRIKLSECNGYQEASRRRKDEFERCNYMQNKAGVKLAPVL